MRYCKNSRVLKLAIFGFALMFSAGAFAQAAQKLVPLHILFINSAGSNPLELKKEYVNSSEEKFNVTSLRYFISNISLTKTDGSEYVIPADSSYFIVSEEDPASRKLSLNVPQGEYTKIRFIVGVDSLKSCRPIAERNGVLDPSSSMDNGMYWSWNSGYIFFRMEGDSPAAVADTKGQHKFRYHIGGFGGYAAPTINNIKQINLNIQAGAGQAGRGIPVVQIAADILKVFDGHEKISLAKHSNVMFSQYSVVIANNYSGIFSWLGTEY
jgi:hypothetical protein